MTAPGSPAGQGPGVLARVQELLAATSTTEPSAADIAGAIRQSAPRLLGDAEMLAALREVQTELVGLGPLQALASDPQVSDVLVVGGGAVWVDRGEGPERTAVRLENEQAVRRLAVRLATRAGRRLDDAQPWVDAHLDGTAGEGVGVRLHAVLPPLSPDGTCISLRLLRPARHRLDTLAAAGTMHPEVADYLRRIIQSRCAFLVCGGTGSGKTTLLAALLGEVAASERIICVEDAAELFPQHPHVVRLVARTSNIEGSGEVSLRALVRMALRMRPDRLVVGEVRGGEVVDLLIALNTGHDGGAGTIHANSVRDVPARLEALGALGGLDRGAIATQALSAISVLIGVRRTVNGQRHVSQIGVLRRDPVSGIAVHPVWDDSRWVDKSALDAALRGRS